MMVSVVFGVCLNTSQSTIVGRRRTSHRVGAGLILARASLFVSNGTRRETCRRPLLLWASDPLRESPPRIVNHSADATGVAIISIHFEPSSDMQTTAGCVDQVHDPLPPTRFHHRVSLVGPNSGGQHGGLPRLINPADTEAQVVISGLHNGDSQTNEQRIGGRRDIRIESAPQAGQTEVTGADGRSRTENLLGTRTVTATGESNVLGPSDPTSLQGVTHAGREERGVLGLTRLGVGHAKRPPVRRVVRRTANETPGPSGIRRPRGNQGSNRYLRPGIGPASRGSAVTRQGSRDQRR